MSMSIERDLLGMGDTSLAFGLTDKNPTAAEQKLCEIAANVIEDIEQNYCQGLASKKFRASAAFHSIDPLPAANETDKLYQNTFSVPSAASSSPIDEDPVAQIIKSVREEKRPILQQIIDSIPPAERTDACRLAKTLYRPGFGDINAILKKILLMPSEDRERLCKVVEALLPFVGTGDGEEVLTLVSDNRLESWDSIVEATARICQKIKRTYLSTIEALIVIPPEYRLAVVAPSLAKVEGNSASGWLGSYMIDAWTDMYPKDNPAQLFRGLSPGEAIALKQFIKNIPSDERNEICRLAIPFCENRFIHSRIAILRGIGQFPPSERERLCEALAPLGARLRSTWQCWEYDQLFSLVNKNLHVDWKGLVQAFLPQMIKSEVSTLRAYLPIPPRLAPAIAQAMSEGKKYIIEAWLSIYDENDPLLKICKDHPGAQLSILSAAESLIPEDQRHSVCEGVALFSNGIGNLANWKLIFTAVLNIPTEDRLATCRALSLVSESATFSFSTDLPALLSTIKKIPRDTRYEAIALVASYADANTELFDVLVEVASYLPIGVLEELPKSNKRYSKRKYLAQVLQTWFSNDEVKNKVFDHFRKLLMSDVPSKKRRLLASLLTRHYKAFMLESNAIPFSFLLHIQMTSAE